MNRKLASLSVILALVPGSLVCAQNVVAVNLGLSNGPETADPIVSGTYTVCSDTAKAHPPHTPSPPGGTKYAGYHLKTGDAIEVTKQVSFGRLILAKGDDDRETEVLMIGDDKGLVGTGNFRHRNKSNNMVEQVTHLVVLRYRDKTKPPVPFPEGCDETKNLLVVSFCWEVNVPAAMSKWQCRDPNMDFGHIHAQEN